MSLTATLAPIDEIISRTNEIIESSRSALDFSEKLSVRIQRLLGDDFSSANVLLVDTMNDLVRDSMQLRDTAIDESPDLMCHEPLTLYDLRTLPLMDFSPVRCLVDCKMTIMSINETFITDNRACIADRVFRLLIWKARGALRSTCRDVVLKELEKEHASLALPRKEQARHMLARMRNYIDMTGRNKYTTRRVFTHFIDEDASEFTAMMVNIHKTDIVCELNRALEDATLTVRKINRCTDPADIHELVDDLRVTNMRLRGAGLHFDDTRDNDEHRDAVLSFLDNDSVPFECKEAYVDIAAWLDEVTDELVLTTGVDQILVFTALEQEIRRRVSKRVLNEVFARDPNKLLTKFVLPDAFVAPTRSESKRTYCGQEIIYVPDFDGSIAGLSINALDAPAPPAAGRYSPVPRLMPRTPNHSPPPLALVEPPAYPISLTPAPVAEYIESSPEVEAGAGFSMEVTPPAERPRARSVMLSPKTKRARSVLLSPLPKRRKLSFDD